MVSDATNTYAGDVTPGETWQALQSDATAQLVDVRTHAEWSFVGLPDLQPADKQPLLVEWQQYPAMQMNGDFVDQLRAAGIRPDQPLYFICRSGARSRDAAIASTAAGLGPCYNVAGGFEGGLDEQAHRGVKEGWKAAGLPWAQK